MCGGQDPREIRGVELPAVFEWLNSDAVPLTLPAIQFGREALDTTWRLPPMVTAWGVGASSLESIRFAAANRLCIQLDYTKDNGERTSPTIEPYAVRQTQERNLILRAVGVAKGKPRTYRLDRIKSATVIRRTFTPRYAVELTASGPLNAPPAERLPVASSAFSSVRSPAARKPARAVAGLRGGFGLSHTFACTMCGKTFKRDRYDATLNPHRNKQGWPCPGRVSSLKATST